MSQEYNYDYSDFVSAAGGTPASNKLMADIEAAALGQDVEWLTDDPDAGGGAGEVVISFVAAITESALDAVIAAHDGVEVDMLTTVHTARMTNGQYTVLGAVGTPSTIEGQVLDPRDLVDDITKIKAMVCGLIQASANGCVLTFIESNDGSLTTLGTYAVPNTGGSWAPFSFETTVDLSTPTDDLNVYLLKGGQPGAVDFRIQYASVSFKVG